MIEIKGPPVFIAEFESDDEQTGHRVYGKAWDVGKHLDIVKIGERYFQLYDGPHYDSWGEVRFI